MPMALAIATAIALAMAATHGHGHCNAHGNRHDDHNHAPWLYGWYSVIARATAMAKTTATITSMMRAMAA